jgi:hypothetical protein
MIHGRAVRGRRGADVQPSAAVAPSPGQPARRTGLARAVTEALAPANLAVAQVLLIGWHSAPGVAGLGWGLLAATFGAIDGPTVT